MRALGVLFAIVTVAAGGIACASLLGVEDVTYSVADGEAADGAPQSDAPAGDAVAPDADDASGCIPFDPAPAPALGGCDPDADPSSDCDGGISCGGLCGNRSGDQFNCGYCGHACTPCTNGACAAVPIGQTDGGWLVGAASGYVYWIEPRGDGGALVRQRTDAGDAGGVATVATYAAPPNDALVEPGRVVVATASGIDILEGCATRHVPSNGNAALSVGSDADGLYWSDSGGNVWRAGRDGAGASHILTGESAPVPTHVFATGGWVYFVLNVGFTEVGASIMRVLPDGGSRQIVAGSLPSIVSLAPGAKAAFVSLVGPGGTSGTVQKIEYESPLPVLLVDEATFPSSLVLDRAFIYFIGQPARGGDYSAWRVSACGGAPRLLRDVIGHTSPTSIAVDEANVYWTEMSGDVYRTTK